MIQYFNLKLFPQKQQLFLIFLVFHLNTNAQNIKSKFFAEAAIGPSFSISKFSNKNYNGSFLSNTDGLAKTGIGINLYVGYQLKKSFGTMLLFGYSQNKQDANSFNRYLKNTFGSNTTTSVETNNWLVFKIWGGGFLTTPFSTVSKLSLQVKILGGVSKTNIPGFKYFYSYPGNSVPNVGNLFFAKVNLPLSFCYQVDAGLKYQLSQKIYLVSDIGYFGSNTVYKYLYNPSFPAPGNFIPAQKKSIYIQYNSQRGQG